jgi:hypothetical protein
VTGNDEYTPPDEATVSAYLANTLDAGQAEAFEAYCLRHPDFARRVESDLYLRKGLRQIQEPAVGQRARSGRWVTVAAAAGLTLIVACGLLLFSRAHPLALAAYRSASDVPAAFLSGPRLGITLIRLREGPKEHRIVAPQGTGVLTVRVMPDSPPGPSGYAMEIAFASSVVARSVTVDKLKADPDGFVEIYLPVAAVVGHTLKVTVTPAPTQGGTPLSFRLQVASSSNTPDEIH